MGVVQAEVEEASVEAGSAALLSPVPVSGIRALDVKVPMVITVTGVYELTSVVSKPLEAGRAVDASVGSPVVASE